MKLSLRKIILSVFIALMPTGAFSMNHDVESDNTRLLDNPLIKAAYGLSAGAAIFKASLIGGSIVHELGHAVPIKTLWSPKTFHIHLGSHTPEAPLVYRGNNLSIYKDLFKGFRQPVGIVSSEILLSQISRPRIF